MPGKTYVQTNINGEHVDFLCEPRQSLLECLRDVIGLTGTKEGCNDGNCGACTVELDGRIVTSCLVLGVEVEGRHTALGDSLVTARVFLRMLDMLEARGIRTLGQAIEVSSRISHVRKMQKRF